MATAPTATAQTFVEIVRIGDTITGIGDVFAVNGLGVNNAGEVSVHVFTDAANLDENAGLVDNAKVPIIWEGDAVNAPPGAVIRSFNGGEIVVNEDGVPAFFIGMLGTNDANDDEGIYYDVPAKRGVQEGSVTTAPELPVGATYEFTLTPRINASKNVCFHALLDPTGGGGAGTLGAIIVLDTATGTQSAPFKEGDGLAGGGGIKEFERDWHALAFNDAGQVMFGGDLVAGGTFVYLDDTKLAVSGEPSPWGSNYVSVASALIGYGLNNHGDYVFHCKTGGTDGIVRNGEGFVRTGETFSSIEPHNLSELGQPLFIGDDGTVFWTGLWNVPNGQVQGLFADHSLIAEEGVTKAGGLVIEDILGLDRSMTISPSGQYLLFKAVLEGGIDAVFLVDMWE